MLLEIGLEVVRLLEQAAFERVLVGSETAVGGRKPGLEFGVRVVERDRERSAEEGRGQDARSTQRKTEEKSDAQVERHPRRLDRVLPQANVLGRDLAGLRRRNRSVGREIARTVADAASDELTVPLARDVPVLLAARVDDLARDLARAVAAPASGLERERAGVASPVVRDDLRESISKRSVSTGRAELTMSP